MIRRFALPSLLGTVAQLTQGVIGLSLLLVGHAHHLPVTTSALGVAAFGIGMAITRPVQGRALDLVSPRVVFAAFGVAHLGVFLLVAAAAQHRWAAVFVLAGFGAGLSLPPIATLMRAEWPRRVDAERATGVFALISSVQMTAVLTAPLLFTVVNAVSGPTPAMLTVAIVSGAGTVAFGVAAGSQRLTPSGHGRVGVRRYLAPLLLTLLLGAVIGTTQVVAPALALADGRPRVAGLLVATATVGALVGSVVAMSRRGRSLPSRTLLAGSTAVQVVGAIVVVLPLPLAVTVPGLFLLGFGDTPAMAALSALIALRARGTAESFGWQSTAQGIGIAVGSAVAGGLAAAGAHWAAVPALLGAAGCVTAGVFGALGAGGTVGAGQRLVRSVAP